MFSRSIILSLPVALLMMLAVTITDAFVPQATTGYSRNLIQQQTQHASRISPLFAAKSGGKIMKDAEMYRKTVLEDTSNPRPTLVFFTAPWCGPCRLTTPCVKEVMQQFSNEIEVVEVCTDDLAEIGEEAGVVSIPTIQFYHQGKKMDTIVGCVAKSVLASAVSQVLEDVAKVTSS
mmetsp:Transcript_32467/g.78813  ORF Transcript_32467/g.78813 Transcript_32467/m.78813 type:complete len:176 (+) Transcript_32467:154-681(+)|eukprot:CAMPEP_0113601990 /NCGR_PEP_ID=MMETSP0017_2-20120614/517_1 /TAXON_ID=2856 /ORGANISM="Cylindrotheca closterium" /LENGTH=175 /DNA_ID=CAMNT_0000510307 /DNA_START=154 /DNA_END=681 /DNA_ORIENTATION=+ /assembly_acc=CAM_ASM_000147